MLHEKDDIHIYKFAFVLVLGLRVGLSLWMAVVWFFVDRYLPLDAAWVLEAFGRLEPHPSLLGRMLLDVWVRWDAMHYLNIARFGYRGVGLGDMNFFPLYPFLTWIVSWVTLGETIFASLIVSTVSTWIAIVCFYYLVLDILQDAQLAKWTVIIWAIYPTSIFLFAPYTDALFAALALGSMLLIYRHKWLLGGFLAVLAALARAQGILLGLVILVEIIQGFVKKRNQDNLRAFLALAMVPIGWIGYMMWRQRRGLESVAGSFAAYSGVYFADPVTTLTRAIQQAIETGELRLFLEIFSLLGFGAVLLWMLTQHKYRQHAGLMIYSAATLGLFLIKHSQVASVYQSATRYVLSVFPVYIGIADLFLRLPVKGRRLYILTSLIGLVIVATLYTLFVFVG